MAETKTCPKCSGKMNQGRIMKYDEYAARNQYSTYLHQMMIRVLIFPKYFRENPYRIPVKHL